MKIKISRITRKDEDKEKDSELDSSLENLKNQIWSSIVTVNLNKAKNLSINENDDSKFSEAYVRLRLGKEVFISKCSRNSRWLESFDFHLFDGDGDDDQQLLEISLWYQKQLYGVARIDLKKLPYEKLNRIWAEFPDKPGKVLLTIFLSSATVVESIKEISDNENNENSLKVLQDRYSLCQTFKNIKDIGVLTVKVFEAMNLGVEAATTSGDESETTIVETFCVIQLGNSRLQAKVEHKPMTPACWNKMFTMNIKDMTSNLEITVFTKDHQGMIGFLGKIAISLPLIGDGHKQWYPLDCDEKSSSIADDEKPMILLEMSLMWNAIRSLGNIFKPKEPKFFEPLEVTEQQRQKMFVQNVNRIRNVVRKIQGIGCYIQNLFEWKSPLRTIMVLMILILACISLNIEDIPFDFACGILLYGCVSSFGSTSFKENSKRDDIPLDNLKAAYQDARNTVEYAFDKLESFVARVKNTLNFTIPTLTWMVAFLFILSALILRYVPISWILLIWTVHKFTKRLIRPRSVISNSLLNFLSRVPDDEEVEKYRELPT